MEKEIIENIFRNSNNSDELFDAFQAALEQKIEDVDLYKILLGNPTLSDDELCMYVEKLSSTIPQKSFDTFLWIAELFEVRSYNIDALEKAFQYYVRAALINPENFLPYKDALNLYNYELEISLNKHIVKFIEDGLSIVKQKSNLHKALAEHYKRIGDGALEKKHEALAQKAARQEND